MTIQHVRELHNETTADAYSAACAEGDCSGHAEDVDCPVTQVSICDYCYDLAQEPEHLTKGILWPCETIRALDQEPGDPS